MTEEKGYIKHTTAADVGSWENRFRERWAEKAKEKNDRIIGDGYAERQIANTLSKVEPIDVRVSMIGPNMNAYIKRGDAVDILTEYFPETEREKWREHFAEILDRCPDVKQKRGSWIRDHETSLRAPGLNSFFCSCCSTYNDTRTRYCLHCGALMKGKK